MHISKVELENFKSHHNSSFEFGCGTTSITGENGAGKTSIIEAIAWTIFDTLDYKKEDIVRRGSKKGIARVTFESGLDERLYTVYRDTNTGYYVYDPQLKARIADKKEEVTRFLWQHLGIEPGTDLESLFKHAIGVPQGTFTAIFLATAAERKKTFDSLLKVEEYRRSSDELLKTVRFVEQQISVVNIKIARAEGEIIRIEPIEEELKSLEGRLIDLTARYEQLEADTSARQREVTRLDEIEVRLGQLTSTAERLRSELSKAELVLRHREADLGRSREAVAILEKVRVDAEVHQNALGRLEELEREREERQKLRDELAKTETAQNLVAADRKHVEADLEKVLKAHAEIGSLKERVEDQERIEHEAALKQRELAKAEGAVDQLKKLDERLVRLRDAYREAAEQLAAAKEKGSGAAQLDSLQNRDAEIVRELANASAALERDQRFQQEIKNGLCPILSQRCLNLSEGQTLESFVSSQFGDLRMRIDTLTTEQVNISNLLRSAREAERFNAQVSVLEARVKEIGDEGTYLKTQKADLEAEAEKRTAIHEELATLGARLKTLDNPKARISVLSREADREGDLREKLTGAERNLERLESDRRIIVEQLESYKDLDSLCENAGRSRDETKEAYRMFVSNEAAAGQLEKNEADFAAASADHEKAAAEAGAADEAFRAASADYDRTRHIAAKSELLELQTSLAESRVMLLSAQQRQKELAAEAERLYEIRRSMQDEFRERERLQKIAETTDFIRSTLREAAPLVARNYVHHVSLEANHMFREIRGDAECSLRWAEDYGIVLEEGGHDRPFQSLSGGEQMAAALSVRLALLKQLSDIHIAFFDEPTTNMDAERRENLAQQIGRISHFDQLFVISHDDTFEGYMDHEVRVGG